MKTNLKFAILYALQIIGKAAIVVLQASILFVAIGTTQIPAYGQQKGASGLPLPRFVSLKSKRVNMRVGPGRDYQVQWLYVRKGLPMEIIREFGNWRKVRDPNGNEGWVLHSLLSGKRMSIITPWNIPKKAQSPTVITPKAPTIKMYGAASDTSGIVANIEAGTLAPVEECENNWCKLEVMNKDKKSYSGYVNQSQLWGVYPDEKIEN